MVELKKKRSTDNINRELGKLADGYKKACYRLFGRSIDLSFDMEETKMRLMMADINFTPGLYFSIIIMSTILASIFSAIFFSFVFIVVLEYEYWFFYVVLLTMLFSGGVAIVYPLIVRMRINKKKGELDKELPYTLSELSVLASTGLSPIQILRSISKKTDNEYMRQEFRKVIYKIDMEGKDIITSLGESAKETPSLHLREALYDFANMIHEGGSIDNYLRKKADQGMSLRRDLQRELIESMSVLMELYLSLVLVVILLTGVGSFLLDVMGQRAGGMSANEILIVVSFFFIPMAIFTVIMFVSTAFSKVE